MQRHPEHTFFLPHKKLRKAKLSEVQKRDNRALSSVRIVVEHLFGRVSYFGAVYQVFRHRWEHHSGVVRVVAWLSDRQIARCLAAGAPA